MAHHFESQPLAYTINLHLPPFASLNFPDPWVAGSYPVLPATFSYDLSQFQTFLTIFEIRFMTST